MGGARVPLTIARAMSSIALALLTSVLACAKATEAGYLSAPDKTLSDEEAPFDPNEIITLAELTDSSVSADTLRALLTYRAVDKNKKNPYGRDSFLATYYSNGIRAVDALVNAAETHRINPIVLLVRAQMVQGLVGMQDYPVTQSRRVEYVFGCGCTGPTTCDPAYSGFDRQADCLAREYRIIIDEMEKNGGITSGGWAKERASRTSDGKSITPADDGTAVVYQFDPRVGGLDEKGGNYLFWNIWRLYVRSASYSPPEENEASGAWIGDPCINNAQCANIQGGACVTTFQGGMCTARCPEGTCPERNGRTSRCVVLPEGNFCFAACSGQGACRGGSGSWACCSVKTTSQSDQKVCTYVPAGDGICAGQ